MISVRTAAGLKAIGAIHVRTAAGLKTVASAYVRTAAATKAIFGQFSVSATPNVNGYGNASRPITISTSNATATVSGGAAPYSYSWSSPDATWSAVNPTAATTSFRKSSVGAGQQQSTTFTVTVTDASGATKTAQTVASVENFGGNA